MSNQGANVTPIPEARGTDNKNTGASCDSN